MSISIQSLPFDVVHSVCILLDVHSYINLGRASKHFYRLLRDENSARICLERNIPYNRDVIRFLRTGGEGSARQTLSLVFDQREAVRNAAPYSVSNLAFGADFIHKQGTLCYISGDEIRILDIYYRSREERVISGRTLATRFRSGLGLLNLSDDLLRHTTLLAYADHILVFLCEETTGPNSWLIALNVQDDDTIKPTIGPCSKLRLCRRLASKTKLFVRHNKDYLYYGTHSAVREDGHHEWLVQGCNLSTGRPISLKPFRLEEFVGSEIGSTACFEIDDGHFYALSNQTSFDTEEVDWTSCYHYIRFKLDETTPDLKLHKIWRRQHHEGPINDSWTELSLHSDEQTNQLNIVEVRKEWLGGGSLCTRTAYTTPFIESQDEDLILDRPNFPSSDQLSRTLDEHSKPSWLEKPPIRIPKFCHHEHTSQSEHKDEFIRARTKHRNYNSSAQSFVDLVADEVRIPNSVRSKDLLRLRIGSRMPASPLIPDDSSSDPRDLRIRPKIESYNGELIDDSEETFTYTAICLWPQTDAPSELFDLLCPGGRVGAVHAVSDERSIIYMAGSPNPRYGGQRAIVMVSFDPGWGHDGLTRLRGPRSQTCTTQIDSRTGYVMDGESVYGDVRKASAVEFASNVVLDSDEYMYDRSVDSPTTGRARPKRTYQNSEVGESSSSAAKRPKAGESGSSSQSQNQQQRLLWTERAMYLNINHGFWLL